MNKVFPHTHNMYVQKLLGAIFPAILIADPTLAGTISFLILANIYYCQCTIYLENILYVKNNMSEMIALH